MSFNLKKNFNFNFGGLDLRSPELLRDQSTATDTLNTSLSENLSLTKRRGFHISNQGKGGAGSVTFNEVDIATGIDTQSRIVFDNSAHKVIEGTVQISYIGAAVPSASIEINTDTNLFELKLFEDTTVSQTIVLGTGLETSPKLIVDLVTDIAGDFSASVTGDPNVRAAFLKVLPEQSFSGSIDLNFTSYEELTLPTGVTNPFQAHWDTRNDDNFEIAQTIQNRDVLYITNGEDGLFKYDGTRLYKAGLPKPLDLVQNAASGAAGTYRYRIVYKYTDSKDNIIFSTPSNELELSNISTLDIPNILQGSGFDTDGDIEIIVLRTKDNLSIFYEIATLTNDPLNAIQTYADTVVDNDLIVEYTLPPFELNISPVCRYIDVWRDQIVLTGDKNSVSTVYYADIEYSEGFSVSNTFLTSTRSGGANTGIKSQDNNLFVFKARSITIVTGELVIGNFQVDTLSDEGIGCLSASSIVESLGKIWFLGRRGVYSVNPQGVTLESPGLTPIFSLELDNIQVQRSVGFYWINEEAILFSLPVKNTSSGETYFEKTSRVLVYHVRAGQWTIWDNLEFTSGINLDGQDVWFNGTTLDSDDTVRHVSSNILKTNTFLDYADHNQPISLVHKTNWESAGEPSVPKKFVRMKVYSLDTPLQGFQSTNFTIDIETNHDYLDEVVSKTSLPFNEDVEGWGSFSWGSIRYGQEKVLTRRTRLFPKKARSLRTILKNSTIYENVLISGLEFEVAYEHGPFMRNR